MDIVLVPGLWLNAHTWDAVVPHLEAAGHRAHPLTLPGMASRDADRTGVTLADHVAAVVAAVDARPGRVARQVHVGGFPTADGEALLSGLPAEDGEVPMPDWIELGEQANVRDFDADQLARFYADAIPVPERVVTDPVRLSDERRFDVPATEICPEYSAADLRGWIDGGHLPELARIRDLVLVDLGGGHWPQLTRPKALAQAVLDAAG